MQMKITELMFPLLGLLRRVIILVKAGAPVDSTIEQLLKYMEKGDIIIDGGNEWCAAQLCW